MFGVNNQSACALPGATTSRSAAIKANFFNIESLLKRILAPARTGASEVPATRVKLNETLKGLNLFAGRRVSAPARAQPYGATATPRLVRCARSSFADDRWPSESR